MNCQISTINLWLVKGSEGIIWDGKDHNIMTEGRHSPYPLSYERTIYIHLSTIAYLMKMASTISIGLRRSEFSSHALKPYKIKDINSILSCRLLQHTFYWSYFNIGLISGNLFLKPYNDWLIKDFWNFSNFCSWTLGFREVRFNI